jgi:hypothetical protein
VEEEEDAILAYHPPVLFEEEVVKLVTAQYELEEMSRWEGFSIQLRQSALAQRHAIPPTTAACTRSSHWCPRAMRFGSPHLGNHMCLSPPQCVACFPASATQHVAYATSPVPFAGLRTLDVYRAGRGSSFHGAAYGPLAVPVASAALTRDDDDE